MLRITGYGWVDIKLGDWEDRASYLTVVYNDLLDNLTFALNHGSPASIYFDAEGWEYIMVCDWTKTYIITEREDTTLKEIPKGIIEVATEVYNDIYNHLDDWVFWDLNVEDVTDKKERNRKKLQLLRKCKKLKEAIDLVNK